MNYAVITGDIVESSQIKGRLKDDLHFSLKEAFNKAQKISKKANSLPDFDIFRGDSFQGLLPDPSDALKTAILIRAMLRKSQPADAKNDWDARMAVGVGKVDYLPENISEGDGEAYQNSGPVLDNLKGNFRCAVKTSSSEINRELKAECALLDAIVGKWTKNQAQIVVMLLNELSPKAISKKLGISQTAVYYRIKGAGWFAVEVLLRRYKQIIESKILKRGNNNG